VGSLIVGSTFSAGAVAGASGFVVLEICERCRKQTSCRSYLGPAVDAIAATGAFDENDNLFDPSLLFNTVFILDNNPPFFLSAGTFGPVFADELIFADARPNYNLPTRLLDFRRAIAPSSMMPSVVRMFRNFVVRFPISTQVLSDPFPR
jgi:hypothetical protein